MNQNKNANQDSQTQEQQIQAILKALNAQRAASVQKIVNKSKALLESENLTVETLGKPEIVSLMRDMVQSIEAASVALASHDKLITFLIQDLTAMVTNIQIMMRNFAQASMAEGAVFTILLDKKIITEEEIEAAQQRLEKAAQEIAEAKQRQENSNVVPLYGATDPSSPTE